MPGPQDTPVAPMHLPEPMAIPGARPPVVMAGLTREQLLVTIGVMAAIAVAALDSTVVGTAMPTIIGQLGGLSEYGWVFSGYLLVSTTTVPLYAKLADIYGRKPVFFVALGLFVAGSMLCGLSGSMLELILFRAIQGIGAGGVQPLAFTIVGDVFEPVQRARMQGVFSAVWGVSAVIGPAIGGIITATVGWRWVFYLNVPVGAVAAVLIGITLHEHVVRHEHRIDWWGALLLSAGIALLLFTVSEGGELFGWTSPLVIGLGVASAASLIGFVVVERTTREPLIDFALLRRPVIASGLAVGALAGVVMFGVQTYVPPMVQGVHGGTPIEAGIAVAAMSIGWPIGSVVGGRAMLRFGPRPTIIAGGAMLVVGTAIFTQVGQYGALWVAVLASAITGLGMGLAATTILVVVQGEVSWRQRGVATGLVQFSRTIGGAVGVGVMGGILAAFVGAASSAILDPIGRAQLTPDQLASGRDALEAGLQVVYWLMAAASVAVAVLAVRTMPAVRLGEPVAVPPAAPRQPVEGPAVAPQAAPRGADAAAGDG